MSNVTSETSRLPALVERGALSRRVNPSTGFTVPPSVNERTIASVLVKQWKYLLFVGFVAFLGGGTLAQYLASQTWTYTATMLYGDSGGSTSHSSTLDIVTVQNVIKNRHTLERLMEQFKLDCSLQYLERAIDTSVPFASRSIIVNMRGEDPAKTEALLNSLVDNCVTEINQKVHEALQQRLASCEVRVQAVREQLAKSQHDLTDFSNESGIVDIDGDLSALRDSLDMLDGAMRMQRKEQNTLLTQRGRQSSLVAGLITNRSEIHQLQAAQAERRKELIRLKNLRHQVLDLTANVETALAARESASYDLHTVSQSITSPQGALSVVHPAQQSVAPPVSNIRKLFVSFFLLISLVLSCPVILSEIKGTRQDKILAAARKLGLPVLASGAVAGKVIQKSSQFDTNEDEYSRLLTLRLQQFVQVPGSVILFSGLDGEVMPVPMLHRIAECFAQRDHRVVVVALDPQYSSDAAFADVMPVDSSNYADGVDSQAGGLGGYLSLAHSDIDLLTTQSVIPNVDYLLPGTMPLPREGFGTQRMTELIARLRQQYTTVIISGPCVNRAVDLELIASRVDGIVLHAFGSQNIARSSSREVQQLMELGAPVLGVIG